jgi:hypothetical protein
VIEADIHPPNSTQKYLQHSRLLFLPVEPVHKCRYCGEVLTPAGGGDRALHDLAVIGPARIAGRSRKAAGQLIRMTVIMRDVIKCSEEMVALKQKLA